MTNHFADKLRRAHSGSQYRRPQPPKGLERTAPKIPRSGKRRRKMLKAAAWRLCRMLNVSPKDAITLAMAPRLTFTAGKRNRAGKCNRLASKIKRLNELSVASCRLPVKAGEKKKP